MYLGNNKQSTVTSWTQGLDNPIGSNVPQAPPIKVNIRFQSPVEYFSFYFTDDFLREIVYQTNLYAFQNDKHNFNLTVTELKVYLGIVLVMSYIKYPRIRQYWSSDGGLRMTLIADAMSLNRFEEIRRYLHFVDASKSDDNNNKLFRIKFVLDHLHKVYHEALDPEEYMSIDEMMIPFKGRSSLKNYLPKKPKRWGYKVWARAGTTGYLYCFEIYQGAGSIDKSELGLAGM